MEHGTKIQFIDVFVPLIPFTLPVKLVFVLIFFLFY